MELEQEQVLPRRVQRAEIDGNAAHRRHEAGDLGLAQRQLILAVGALDLAVGRVGAAVRLQIELANPGGEVRG